MDFGFTAEQEQLRSEVKEFIRENVTREILSNLESMDEQSSAASIRSLYKKISERGWTGISWPKEYGGQGGSRIDQYIVEEEFSRVGLQVGGAGSGAPAILDSGTEEQKSYFIPRIIAGDVIFALGFTEPSGGTDLASLRTTAIREDDSYVVNGQKMFTSAAHYATHMYLMCRTDPTAERYQGISILIFPMNIPGITIRPLLTIQSDPPAPLGTTYRTARTNEVFLDNVRVPLTCLLGEENRGWAVGANGLNLDRIGAARYLISVRRDEDIINWAKTHCLGKYEPLHEESIRDRLIELWIEAQVCRLMTMRSMSLVDQGKEFLYEASAEKVWAPEHGVRTTEVITQILGPYTQLLNGSEDAIERGLYAHNVLGAFQSSINHGSVQVMRDQVARRGLGLPRSY